MIENFYSNVFLNIECCKLERHLNVVWKCECFAPFMTKDTRLADI